MNTTWIWVLFAIAAGIWGINDEFELGLPADLMTFFGYVAGATFATGFAIAAWKSLVEWKDEKDGIGNATLSLVTDTVSSIWKLAVLFAVLGVGIFIITSLFANPMMTIIWVFVAIVIFLFIISN